MVYYPELMPYFATSNNKRFLLVNVRIENFHL